MSILTKREALLSQVATTGKFNSNLYHSFRILKVWDRDTLTLQASLHGH